MQSKCTVHRIESSSTSKDSIESLINTFITLIESIFLEEEDVQKKDNTQNDGEANVTEPIRKETLKNMPSKTKIECQNSDQDKSKITITIFADK